MNDTMKQEDIIKKYWFLTRPIECGDGWLPLIKYMCEEINELIETKFSEFKNLECPFEFSQIKEKYGVLVCYPSFGNKEIFEIINKYEDKSNSICELCGRKGEMRNINNWYQTLCYKCLSKRLKELRIKGVDV